MIIQKIEIENFTCYSGSNTFEFREGVNIIIGDNGYGKSQLFDAFYWVINNQIFMSKESRPTREVRSALISDKAKSEIEKGIVTAVVQITFREERTDKVYILERKYSITKNEEQILESGDSEFSIYKKELSTFSAKLILDEKERDDIIKRILPANKKEYLWFQGEQVDKIIDFQQNDTLTKAIRVLSDINTYDELAAIAKELSEAARIEYEREVKRLSKDKIRSDELEKTKSELERNITNLRQEAFRTKSNLDIAESKFDSLVNKMKETEAIKALYESKKSLQKEIKDIWGLYRNELVSFNRKLFRNKWVIKGTEILQPAFEQKFNKYINLKLEFNREIESERIKSEESAKMMSVRLPIDVPEPIYVQKMLEEERCLVCDREALKGSEAWVKMKELIDRVQQNKKDIPSSPLKHNFEYELRALYNTGLVLSRRIEEVDEDIRTAIESIYNYKTLLNQKELEISEKEQEIEKLATLHSIDEEDAVNLSNEFLVNKELSKKYADQLNNINQNIKSYSDKIAGINQELESLVTSEVASWIVQKKSVLKEFEIVANSTRVRVFENLIARIELEANRHYHEMTVDNKSFTGQIKLVKRQNGNYLPTIVNDRGEILLGLGTGNLTLIKLAVIMAIVSLNYQDLGGADDAGIDLYTLISDAPTSVFGEAYTMGFCKTVSKVYKQSIIMSKDFYKNERLRSELLKNKEIKLGSVYMITPSILESQRTDRTKLSTIIEKIR